MKHFAQPKVGIPETELYQTFLYFYNPARHRWLLPETRVRSSAPSASCPTAHAQIDRRVVSRRRGACMFGRGLVDVEGQGLGRVLVTPTLTIGQCIDRGRQHGQEWPAGLVRRREHGSGHGRTSGRGMSARRPLDTRSGADQSWVCVGGGGGVGINILTGGQSVKWSVCGRRTLS